MNQKEKYVTELDHVLITKYATGYICGGYDSRGNQLMDGEAKETPQEAVNSLLYYLNHSIVEHLSQANTFEQQTNSSNTVRTVNEPFEQVFEPGIVSTLETIPPASVQVKVKYSLRFLKWLLQMNRMMNRALEAMIVFLESDGKAP